MLWPAGEQLTPVLAVLTPPVSLQIQPQTTPPLKAPLPPSGRSQLHTLDPHFYRGVLLHHRGVRCQHQAAAAIEVGLRPRWLEIMRC